MEERPTDTLGIVSLVLGVLTWMSCFGSCIPYVGALIMFPSMFLSLIGTIVGVIGTRVATTNEVSPGLSISGAVLNGIPLLIWICYWLFVILAVVFLFVALALGIALDSM